MPDHPSTADPSGRRILNDPAERLAGLRRLLISGEPVETFSVITNAWPDLCHDLDNGIADPAGNQQRLEGFLDLVESSCRAAAASLHRQRRFEEEEERLALGQDLLAARDAERARTLGAMRGQLQRFRIRDLLAAAPTADPSSQRNRDRGLELLGDLIRSRMASGEPPESEDPASGAVAFESFLEGIRSCLSMEEWLACWEEQHRLGHPHAVPPLVAALVATGFRSHRPGRIARALSLLEESGGSRCEEMAGLLRILLGEGPDGASAVERAMQLDRLQQWLGQEVLPGYRDSTTWTDLESWFTDPEVLNHGDHRPRSLPLFPPGPSAGRSAPEGWNG